MFISSFLNSIRYFSFLILTGPMDILGESDAWYGDNYTFAKETGLLKLTSVLNAFGLLSAGIIILASLGTLVIVNYPKTKAQVKEKLANAFMMVAFLAAFPFIADVIYNVMINVFFK